MVVLQITFLYLGAPLASASDCLSVDLQFLKVYFHRGLRLLRNLCVAGESNAGKFSVQQQTSESKPTGSKEEATATWAECLTPFEASYQLQYFSKRPLFHQYILESTEGLPKLAVKEYHTCGLSAVTRAPKIDHEHYVSCRNTCTTAPMALPLMI